jgi:predicted pyridoxine 5'-phosphate oxidase superfamily flavin-nucleotide-binding protein
VVIINNELKQLIEENALAFASINKNGNPHCIAVGFVKLISKDQILITDNYIVETIKNIQKSPNIALTVWNKEWKENCIGYELIGTAEYFTEGKWYNIIKNIPENKGEPCKGAILVTINKIKSLA